jgi:hypothetical protein
VFRCCYAVWRSDGDISLDIKRLHLRPLTWIVSMIWIEWEEINSIFRGLLLKFNWISFLQRKYRWHFGVESAALQNTRSDRCRLIYKDSCKGWKLLPGNVKWLLNLIGIYFP